MKNTFFFFTLIIFTACNKPNADIKQFKWLEGKWEGNYNGMQTFEEWQPLKDNVMAGIGGMISNKDTMFVEKVKIEIQNGELYYVATVPENPEPVPFRLIKSVNNSTTFENPEHDFPQRIIYTQNADGSLYSSIEGKRMDKYSKKEFHFQKVK
ncbi:MAG: DUF6265 family protein [Bacteroidota bacterium]